MGEGDGTLRSVEWIGDVDGHLALVDQTRLPGELVVRACEDPEAVAEAIGQLRVRGAPAIGTAAAFGVVLGAHAAKATSGPAALDAVDRTGERLRRTRPTAVNLFAALDRQRAFAAGAVEAGADAVVAAAFEAARAIEAEDHAACDGIAEHGVPLIPQGAGVITHCNTGALATSGIGTALGVIVAAHRAGRAPHVWVDETRPLLQGARLTAFELARAGARATLICDAAAAQVIAEGRVDVAIVGADRIAANGDTANKIGTLGLALAARAGDVPFYVAAPTSTIDRATASGADIPIEERADTEVRGNPTGEAASGVDVYNPAFDVTPAHLIAGIITERGVLRPPFEASIAALCP